jgi:hypothetical protein
MGPAAGPAAGPAPSAVAGPEAGTVTLGVRGEYTVGVYGFWLCIGSVVDALRSGPDSALALARFYHAPSTQRHAQHPLRLHAFVDEGMRRGFTPAGSAHLGARAPLPVEAGVKDE